VHGVLQVFAASYLGEEVLGQCVRLSDDKTGCTKAAQIELVACDVATVAHEIGHALGLPHVESERNLMFPYSTGRMGLDAAQRASVTQ
jgi:predicted Zn-dependent protease